MLGKLSLPLFFLFNPVLKVTDRFGLAFCFPAAAKLPYSFFREFV
jgi:hypothetical protein